MAWSLGRVRELFAGAFSFPRLNVEIQIESTDKITSMDGVPVRLWAGLTASGVPCHVFVHRVAVANSVDQSQFERELSEMPQPERVHLDEILRRPCSFRDWDFQAEPEQNGKPARIRLA